MNAPRLAVGFAAAVPPLVLGALMLFNGLTDPSPTNLAGPVGFGALLLGGVALALAGLARDRPAWVPPGAALIAVGSMPLFLGGIGILAVLGAVLLVAVSLPSPPTPEWRWGAGILALAAALALAYLAWGGIGSGRAPTPVDVLLWASALGLVVVAAWPVRALRPARNAG